MLNKYRAIFFGILSIFFLLSSCKDNMVFDRNAPIPSEGWQKDDRVVFEVELSDTVNLHNLFVNVRNSTSYSYSNLFLFLDIDFPDGRRVRDTLEAIIADSTGRWTGRGGGRLRSNQFLFRTDVWFPQKGTYRFSFQQAMRTPTLEGINDIGLSIERK